MLILLAIIIWAIHPIIWQYFIPSSQLKSNTKNIQIAAHRGASNLAPENTLAAIQKALEIGVEIIEIDVHLTKDHQLVVLHDELLDRTTNGTGKVSDFTLKELKQLDAGSWFSKEFKDEKIPTLAEVLNLINGKSTCLIEIKWTGKNLYVGIEQKIISEIEAINATSWTIVQSFEASYLEHIHAIQPNIYLAQLLLGSWQFPIPFHFDRQFHWGAYNPPKYIKMVNFYKKRATPMFINHLKNKGVKVGVFTPNLPNEITKQINMGVDAVITNNPELALKLIDKN